jgi:LCP family protein required for cell wall assembly
MATIAPPPPQQRRAASPQRGSTLPPTSVAQARAQAAALRRAILLMIATVLVPGSAQRFAGNRRVGTIALRIWLATVAVIGLLALVATQRPTLVVSLASSDTVLTAGKVAIGILGAGWLALVLDAWRLGRPATLSRRGRLGMTGLTAVTFGVVAGLLSTGMHLLDVQRDVVGSVFAKGPSVGAVDGRYNVLVLGGDAGADREGLRPDSITVVSVDAESGQTVLVGIPRNMMDVPFPEGSPLAQAWPNGFDCGDECLMNAIYTWANENAELLPDAEDPGIEATRQAAEAVTGLSIPYTAVVDMAGFEQLVDAMGGVTVDVGKRVPIGALGNIEGYIEPGVQTLNGYQALWFARSREGSSDYERMVRQKCLTSSLARQADPITVVRNYEALANASTALVSTDIPTADLPGLLTVATKAQGQSIDAVSLVPPLVDPANPDFDEIRGLVQRLLSGEPAVGATEESGDGSVGTAGSDAASAMQGGTTAQQGSLEDDGATGGSSAPAVSATAADLGLVCQAA